MNKQEKIVCAAIQYSARDYKNGGFSEPKHICGVDYKFIEIQVAYTSPIRGFATSKNRFVDAKEAMEIAVKARQITSPVDLVVAMKNRIKMAKLDPEEYGGESYIKHLESEIKVIDTTKTELKPEDLY